MNFNVNGVCNFRGRAFLILAQFFAVICFSNPASADSIDDIELEAKDIGEQALALSNQYFGNHGFQGQRYPEERLIDGENFYRLKDFQRAAIIFMDIMESFPNHAIYPEALFYFADSLFHSRDYYGSRQWFETLLDAENKPGYGQFRQKSMERLVEIAIHLDDYDRVEKYFLMLGSSIDAEAHYIKGKYLYFRDQTVRARSEFEMVSGNLELELKSKYFIGVICTKEGKYDEAIEVFKSGIKHEARTSSEQEIIDLINLGLGRLYYEKDFVENASIVYQSVSRYSPFYDSALYEAAAVQIRAGNTIAAERILEVLTLAMPDSMYIPRAKLLRGNLLLRSGRYDDAENVFEETVNEFGPIKNQINKVIGEKSDSKEFFNQLVKRSDTLLDISTFLSPMVVKWMGEDPHIKRVMSLASDLGFAQEYVRETERLFRMIKAVLNGSSAINAIPSMRDAKRRCQQLQNTLSQLRGRIAKMAESKFRSSAEFDQLAMKRKELQGRLDSLPTTADDYQKREEKAGSTYKHMRYELARNIARLDNIIAMIVALERYISNPKYLKNNSEESLDALAEELIRHKVGAKRMFKEINNLREDIEKAQYQIGVGDRDDQGDETLRLQIAKISEQEQKIMQSNGGALGAKLNNAFAVIERSEKIITQLDKHIVNEADRQIAEMKKLLKNEQKLIASYRTELSSLDEEAEDVVTGVAYENFSSVRTHFRDLVLKADMGIIDVAWMRKEEHKSRGISLTKDRLTDVQSLDEEFNEVNVGQHLFTNAQTLEDEE